MTRIPRASLRSTTDMRNMQTPSTEVVHIQVEVIPNAGTIGAWI